ILIYDFSWRRKNSLRLSPQAVVRSAALEISTPYRCLACPLPALSHGVLNAKPFPHTKRSSSMRGMAWRSDISTVSFCHRVQRWIGGLAPLAPIEFCRYLEGRCHGSTRHRPSCSFL